MRYFLKIGENDLKLCDILQVTRKSKRITLMDLVKSTGLSYGKIYRILNGTLENPSPAYIKKLSNSLGLDYTYLLEVSGVIQPKIKTKVLK